MRVHNECFLCWDCHSEARLDNTGGGKENRGHHCRRTRRQRVGKNEGSLKTFACGGRLTLSYDSYFHEINKNYYLKVFHEL